MGNFGGVVAAIVGVLLAGLTAITAVNVSGPDDAGEVGQEELIDYDER